MLDRSPSCVYFRTVFALLAALFFLSFAGLAHASDRKILTKVRPEYPPIAKRMKITGSVLLSVVVLPSGQVKAANFVMGEHVLLEAAQAAVQKWKYEPADEQTIEDVELEFPRDTADAK